MIVVRESGGAVTFSVRVQPGARKSGVTGVAGEALKLATTAPALEGRANEAVVELLAKLLRVPKSSITIAAGRSGRTKVVKVAGVASAAVSNRLNEIVGGQEKSD